MGTSSIKVKHTDRFTRAAKGRFGRFVRNGNFYEAARIAVVSAIVMSGTEKLMSSLRRGDMIYRLSKEV